MKKNIFATFLWFYPLLFLIDASFSIIDDVTSYFLAVKLLSSVREVFALGVYFLTVPFLISIFLYDLKKSTPYWLLPIFNVLVTIITSFNIVKLVEATSLFSTIALNMSPHFIYNKNPLFFSVQLLCTLTQLALGIYAFHFAWKNRLEVTRKEFQWKMSGLTTVSFLMSFFIVNLVTLISIFTVSSKGFLNISGNNVVSIEKIYQRNGKIVHLIPMIHVGSENFYKEISSIDIKKKTLILLEGVRDQNNLMESISYRKMANATGLSAQEEKFRPKAKTKELQKNLSYLVADVDASDFSPETRQFINALIKDMNQKSFFEVLMSNYDYQDTSDSISHLSVDLIEKRNQKVLQDLMANQTQFEEFYIPWGAAHLPEIERELLRVGFKETDRKQRIIISISEVFKNEG